MKKNKNPPEEFNYSIGHYWIGEDGAIGCYTYFNAHWHGTMKDAESMRQRAKTAYPDREWKIFKLVDVK